MTGIARAFTHSTTFEESALARSARRSGQSKEKRTKSLALLCHVSLECPPNRALATSPLAACNRSERPARIGRESSWSIFCNTAVLTRALRHQKIPVAGGGTPHHLSSSKSGA